MNIQTGATVKWTSQAQGYERTKEGVVVAVVPAGERPESLVPAGSQLRLPGSPRAHESYLVQVGKSKTLYWPRVSALKT